MYAVEKPDQFGFRPGQTVDLAIDEVGFSRTEASVHGLQKQGDDFSQPFCLCGPPAKVKGLQGALAELGATTESMVFEE